ncbi:hypothetical protein [uncultured Erythrobacter sp.]|uniref:hypothetical protein n=1 Tax=uncultured Erythrobacter sp. TaxID=263913 RepID=UPI002658AC6C|nr:hypothetical protein [uncultured Erythrobacter sp.]
MADVEEMLALDVRTLRRLGALQAGECIIYTVQWSQRGLRGASVRLRSDLSDMERGGVITIAGTMPDDPIRQDIAIEPVSAGFGGYRLYFICPVTADRCEVLYYARGRFASRRAHRLSYMSQNLTDLSRARRKVAKLSARLEGRAGFRRPRGGNRTEMVDRLHDAALDAHALYVEKLRSRVEGSGTRL